MTTAQITHQHSDRPTEPGRRSGLEIAGRAIGGLLAVAVGAAQGFLWWLASALTCDEGCDDRSHLWRDNPDAWQWSALAWLGAGCFALCVAFAVSLAARRPRLSGTLLTAAFLVGIAPWILYGSV
jgi:hypothetical protein